MTLPVRVLVFESRRRVCEALVALLRTESDFEVVGAAVDEAEALKLAVLHQPDLVLLDPIPGGQQAYEIVRAMRRAVPGAVLLLHSNEVSPGQLARATAEGADGFVYKAIPPDQFVVAIRRAYEVAAGRYRSQTP